MSHLLAYFFAWPSGAVWGNLLASLLWGAPTYFHLKRKIKKHTDIHVAIKPKKGEPHRPFDV